MTAKARYIYGRLPLLRLPRYYTERMNTDATLQISATSLEQSLALAEVLGSACRGGEVIELISDLGGGKTTFVKGLARGIHSTDVVSSPSFTLSNVYAGTQLTIQHFDFYRLHEAGIMREELAEVMQDKTVITVVEWGDIVAEVLPAERLTIRILNTGESSRQFRFSAPESLKYLIKAMTP